MATYRPWPTLRQTLDNTELAEAFILKASWLDRTGAGGGPRPGELRQLDDIMADPELMKLLGAQNGT